MQLGTYAVPDGQGGEIEIPNARVVECAEHGVRPVDQTENNRWRTLVFKQSAPLGPGQDSCYNCQKPRALVGQMYSYGEPPKQIHLCGECNETIDYRDLTPLRDDN
jgi:hypothetical protein